MAKKTKRGRPSQGRSEYLEVRLTPKEKEAFEEAADSNGVSLSDWVRLNLRAASIPAPMPLGEVLKMHGKTGGD